MNRSLTIEVPGKPIAKKRPRFYRRGNYAGTYSDQVTEAGRFILEVKSQIQNIEGLPIPAGVPVDLVCMFYFPIPASLSKKRLIELNMMHTKKPDADNCLKFVKDCLNGIVWHDDAQVACVKAMKVLADKPMTKITVRWSET